MGDKVTVTPVTSLDNSSTANNINQNANKLANEFDNVMYRDGSVDALGDFNMNSKRLLNVGPPRSLYDVARMSDLVDLGIAGVIELPSDFVQAGLGAVTRTVEEKLRDVVSVKDFGAVGDGATDDTAAFVAARNTNAKKVSVPNGTYSLTNLVLDRDYQEWDFGGAIIVKRINGPLITITGRGVEIHGGQFSGNNFASNVIESTGQETKLYVKSCRSTTGRAMLFINSSGCVVDGGIVKTEDAAGYDIEFRNTGVGALYNTVSNVRTNNNAAGLYLNGAGTTFVFGNQFGRLTIENGGGGMFVANRFVGNVSVQSSGVQMAGNAFAGNMTFGTDGQPNIGTIAVDGSNFMSTGRTFTIAANVVDSSFHLGQIYHPSSTVVIRGLNNDLWHPEVPITLTLGAAGGTPVLADAIVNATMSRTGKQWTINADVQLGAGSSLGSGNFFFVNLPVKAKSSVVGPAQLTEAGVGFYGATARVLANSNQLYLFNSSSTAAANPYSASTPFTWGNGDRMVFSISGEYTSG